MNCTPLDSLNLHADWSWTATDWNLQSFQRQKGGSGEPKCSSVPEDQTPQNCPAQVWTSYGRQQGNTIDLGFTAKIPANRLLHKPSELQVQYYYTVTDSLTHANGDEAFGPATDFPDVGSRFHQLFVNYRYFIRSNAALNIGYYFSNFGENDFGYDQLTPSMKESPQSVFLGNSSWTPFTGNAAYISVQYKF
jgi:hypothetical protein